jgi:hypothetical protein
MLNYITVLENNTLIKHLKKTKMTPKEKNIARAFLILGFILGVLTTISISL